MNIHASWVIPKFLCYNLEWKGLSTTDLKNYNPWHMSQCGIANWNLFRPFWEWFLQLQQCICEPTMPVFFVFNYDSKKSQWLFSIIDYIIVFTYRCSNVLHDIDYTYAYMYAYKYAYLSVHKYGKYVNGATQQQNVLLMQSMYIQCIIKIILCQQSSRFDRTTAFFFCY